MQYWNISWRMLSWYVCCLFTYSQALTLSLSLSLSLSLFLSNSSPELLPLKAGVAVMALGTVAKHSVPVKIVPCGLNYFSGRDSLLPLHTHPFNNFRIRPSIPRPCCNTIWCTHCGGTRWSHPRAIQRPQTTSRSVQWSPRKGHAVPPQCE